MSDKTVIQSPDKSPSIQCAACGEKLPIFDSLDSLPEAFPVKCGHCGEEAMYRKSDITPPS